MTKNKKWYDFMFNDKTGDDYVTPMFILVFIIGFILGALAAL